MNYESNVWWEEGKKTHKNISINYTQIRNKEIQTKLKKLYETLNQEETKRTINTELISNINKQIEQIEKYNNYSTILRSRAPETETNNTNIYNKIEIQKGQDKEINKVKNEDNHIVEEKEQILDTIHKYYQKLYTSQNIQENIIEEYLKTSKIPKLTSESNIKLKKIIITKDSVFKALKSFEPRKSPGMDGLNKEFYMAFWDLLGDDLTEILNNIIFSNKLSETMKNAIITIKYKDKGDINDLKNWRPISLLCTDYKIF